MTHVAETIYAAANPEHEWDRRALDWPDLPPRAVVVEVGGYKGRWALQMIERYPSIRLHVYEPQPWAAAVCRAVLGERAQVYDYGLGVRDETLPMARYETDGCTFVGGDGPALPLRDAAKALPKQIGLMLINIEGYEYTLIPYLIAKGITPRRLVVQFHTHADVGGWGMAAVSAALLTARYRLLWDYGPTLMAWRRA